jgi:aminomethyltransferase
VQGPKAAAVLERCMTPAALELDTYRFMEGEVLGAPAVLSRTGYTGEDGFELYFDPSHAAGVWDGLMAAGAPHGLEAVGLGARDTLRLEMGYMLYGNDIDESTSPLEAGLGWAVKMAKGDFVGRTALAAQKERGLARRLVGVGPEGRRVPRHGMTVLRGGRPAGQVTSGTFSPSLERPIGMAYVEVSGTADGTALEVDAGRSQFPARVVKRPFYTQGSRRAGAA